MKLVFGMLNFLREVSIFLFKIAKIIFLNEEDFVDFQYWKHTNIRLKFKSLEIFIAFEKSILYLLN